MQDQKAILFLNLESSHVVGFRNPLEEMGYNLIEPSSYGEASEMIATGEIHLLIYADTDSSKRKEICLKLANHFPRLPIIYILANDSAVEEEIRENAHRKIVRPLSQKGSLLTLIDDLLEIGRWVNVSRPMPQNDLFKTIDLKSVLDQMLGYFAEKITCENIIWMNPSELHRLGCVEGKWGRVEPIQKFGQPANLRALNGTTEVEVVRRLADFKFSKTYFKKGPWPALWNCKEKRDVIIPVMSVDSPEPLGFLNFQGIEDLNVELIVKQVAETLTFMNRHLTYSVAYFEMSFNSYKDDLTDLYNQKFLYKVLTEEIKIGQEQKSEFSVLFLDIDYFKLVNDSKGHWVGSHIIKKMGPLLKGCVRARDYVFRYGGDEFVVVLSGNSEVKARIVAERIRKQVEETVFKVDGHELSITVSIGLAEYPKHATTRKALVKMADEAMYFGKNRSRNVVYIAS